MVAGNPRVSSQRPNLIVPLLLGCILTHISFPRRKTLRLHEATRRAYVEQSAIKYAMTFSSEHSYPFKSKELTEIITVSVEGEGMVNKWQYYQVKIEVL